jgi:hypothetical protein
VRNSAYRGEAALSPVISLALPQALQSWDGFLDGGRDREVVVERPDGSRLTIVANVDPLFDSAAEIPLPVDGP